MRNRSNTWKPALVHAVVHHTQLCCCCHRSKSSHRTYYRPLQTPSLNKVPGSRKRE